MIMNVFQEKLWWENNKKAVLKSILKAENIQSCFPEKPKLSPDPENSLSVNVLIALTNNYFTHLLHTLACKLKCKAKNSQTLILPSDPVFRVFLSFWITGSPPQHCSPQTLLQSPCWMTSEETRRKMRRRSRWVQADGTSLQQLNWGRGEKRGRGGVKTKWEGEEETDVWRRREHIRWSGEKRRDCIWSGNFSCPGV